MAIAVVIKTEDPEGPRFLGKRFTIDHILDPRYHPRRFNGSWISGSKLSQKTMTFSYSCYKNGVVILQV